MAVRFCQVIFLHLSLASQVVCFHCRLILQFYCFYLFICTNKWFPSLEWILCLEVGLLQTFSYLLSRMDKTSAIKREFTKVRNSRLSPLGVCQQGFGLSSSASSREQNMWPMPQVFHKLLSFVLFFYLLVNCLKTIWYIIWVQRKRFY